MSSLKKSVRDLNLFKPDPNSGEVEDDQSRRSNIISTRIYILFLILILFGTGIVLSLIDETTIITLKHPTKEQFEALPTDAQCSCSQISLSYGKFISLQASYHQVCSSDFVSDRWLNAINFGANSTYFHIRDFRTYGSAQFQALAAFCRLSKANIEQNIALFYLNTLLSPQVLSEKVLQSQTQGTINQFQSTAPNTFRAQLRLLNQMTVNNRLMSGLQTNAYFNYRVKSDYVKEISLGSIQYTLSDGTRCICDVELCNKISSSIYDIFGASTSLVSTKTRWKIPGYSTGCLPVNSILVSTLECFYNQTCLNNLTSYFPANETFKEMAIDESSRYGPTSTVQSMVDNLMVEEWIINISYDKYYSQCAPYLCTYFKVSRHSFVFVITKLLSLLASLTLVLQLVIPPVVRFLQRLRHPTPSPRISICLRLHQFKAFIRKTMIELNTFKHYPSTDRQIRYQRYGTRLYIILLFSSIGILSFYTLLERSNQMKSVLHPTQSEYMQLHQDYSRTLSCPCTEISMSYLTFITVQPQYHQLCSSDLISKRWIMYIIDSRTSTNPTYYLDYLANAQGQFQSLSMFCQQAQQTINDSFQMFLQRKFVSSHVLSNQSFQVRVNSLIEEWKLTTINTFMRTIQLIRATNQGNQLFGGVLNIKLELNPITRKTIIRANKFLNCSCALSSLCRVNAGIYNYDKSLKEFNLAYSIPNFFAGCYPIEALFASTLECFYNLSCMLEIHSHINSPLSFNFSSLNASLNHPHERMESIVNQLMVDKWLSNISFDSYYNKCSPSLCTFQYEQRNTLFFVFTTIVNIFGGLSLGLNLIIKIGLKLIDKIITNGFSCMNLVHSIKYLFICKTEYRMIRRLHFFLVVTILCIIYMFSAFTPYTTTDKIEISSLSNYTDLIAQSHNSLQCPCSQISIKYKSFLNIKTRFHQVCSSDFVSDRWIKHLYGDKQPVDRFNSTDFYYSASGQFQLLASLCELSKETVNSSILQLNANDFINTQLLSPNLFNDRIQTTINEFQLTMPNLFVNTLSLIRETTGANMFMSVLSTSWIFSIPSNITHGWAAHTEPLNYQGCSCALSSKCVSPSRRMLTGCYALEAILQTTLECLYDQQCIDSKNIFKAINISSLNSSRFPLNTTVESIVNQLMVEEFLNDTSYESYFNQCAPLTCTYSYVNNNNIIEGITTLIGLYGGLLIICHLLSIFIVKQFLCISNKVSVITD